ncbi:MAG: hypothetical protein IKI95_03265 [Clostridia bacterium]|nr:hypothetical protein [Clostridia bacterium]
MTNEQLVKLKFKLAEEIDEYKKEMLEKTKSEIYDSCFEISSMERIHQYLISKGRNYKYEYMPKNNICKFYYDCLNKMGFELTNENLDDVISFEIYKARRDSGSEM